MILDFSWLPPEINSARIYAGAGSGPLFMAAAAWEGLAADLRASASSFDAVIAGLAAGPWSGPASVAMAGAEPPRHVRRLQFLERMGSCQVVHRGGTRRSCV
ncbi:PPE domain-containing protein, partial [Mycobacterium tuberculosis]|uniref:PPE domain-containing protein n=1 Tax=Mycobacterium tuberculosis TaxID=1773 RepID=UPI001F31DAED